MPARYFFHHVVVFASDFAASEPFYTQALATLGITSGAVSETGLEYWNPADDTPSFAVDTAATSADVTRNVHLAFDAADRAAVMPSTRRPSRPAGPPGTSRGTGPSTRRTQRSSATRTEQRPAPREGRGSRLSKDAVESPSADPPLHTRTAAVAVSHLEPGGRSR